MPCWKSGNSLLWILCLAELQRKVYTDIPDLSSIAKGYHNCRRSSLLHDGEGFFTPPKENIYRRRVYILNLKRKITAELISLGKFFRFFFLTQLIVKMTFLAKLKQQLCISTGCKSADWWHQLTNKFTGFWRIFECYKMMNGGLNSSPINFLIAVW